MDMADAMAYGGYKDAGYEYVCIDVSAPSGNKRGIRTLLCRVNLRNRSVKSFICNVTLRTYLHCISHNY